MFLVFFFHQGTHLITRHSSPLPMASKNCILIFLTLVSIFLPLTQSIHFKFPAVFNFGDSNSDTGNLVAAGIESIRPPYGEIHFQIPSGRYCDGRLIIDFLSKSPTSIDDFMLFSSWSCQLCFYALHPPVSSVLSSVFWLCIPLYSMFLVWINVLFLFIYCNVTFMLNTYLF